MTERPVLPTHDDPLVAGGSGSLGGPLGAHARTGTSWWTPIRVVICLAVITLSLGWWQKYPCMSHGWSNEYQYTRMCYTDVYALYWGEGLNSGEVPYRDHPVEYPVIIGAAMGVASWAGHLAPANDQPSWYFTVTIVLLAAATIVTVVSTTQLAGRRPWDGALVALAPILVMHAYTNWDMLAAAFTGAGMVAWARRKPQLAGALLGLGIATKLYPILILVALLPLCARAHRLRPWAVAAGSALAAWVVVNAPVFFAWRSSWGRFFSFNRSRGADWDSIWFQLGHWTERATSGPLHWLHGVVAPTLADGQAPAALNNLTSALAVVLFAAIGWLVWRAPRRPRVAQVAFLIVVAFLLSNKVFSPQYVVWYLPLAALALPRWRILLAWQFTEFLLVLTRFFHFVSNDTKGADGIDISWFFAGVLVRDAMLLLLAGLVVRDIYQPWRDPVRAAGMDDPAGGVLDGAPDRGEPEPSYGESGTLGRTMPEGVVPA